MTDYTGSGGTNKLIFLGHVLNTATGTSPETLGTIEVGAGTFGVDDRIIVKTTSSSTGIAGQTGLRITVGATNLDLNAANATRCMGDFECGLSPTTSTIGILSFRGVRSSTTSSQAIAETDLLVANWITGAFSIVLRGTGDSSSGTSTIDFAVYRLKVS